MGSSASHIFNNKIRIAIIGLGYVGLPLAVAFAKSHRVLGFDIDKQRIHDLRLGVDRTKEIDAEELLEVTIRNHAPAGLTFSDNPNHLRNYNTYVITVPTPVDTFKSPDLTPLLHASELVANVLKPGDLVIFESTVYPGCTEEECVPLLERISSLKFNQDFYVGYSPERISPGEKTHKLTDIVKVTSGSTPQVAKLVDTLYRSIIIAGTYQAPSIKVAEAAKAVENAQRDINISFVNELALIFDRLGIDTHEVLEAASTKWNFQPYKPGLVGGHCIGVDPYYLTHKAQQVGYLPNVILSGRRVNEQMGAFVAEKVVKLMIQKDLPLKGAKALILGITFKENCPDIRNTRVIDIYQELMQFGLQVALYDPWANADEVKREYGLETLPRLRESDQYDAIILAVAHSIFSKFDLQLYKAKDGVVFDTKAFLDRKMVDGRL